MSHGDARPGDTGHEPLGSVGEEAAKLFDALQDWARESARGTAHDHPATGDTAGGAECTWCPVCRGTQLLRQTSPEVRAHLTVAASSLLQAAAGLIAAAQSPTDQPPADRPRAGQPPGASSRGVQKIDLDDLGEDEPDWDAD